MAAAAAVLPAGLKDAHFTIYSKADCVFCDKAEALLQEFGLPYKKEFESEYTKFPQIFVNDTEYVGGYPDLVCMLREQEEPILSAPKTYTLVPVHQDLWTWYKKQVACFWTPEEIDFAEDLADWASLEDGERHFLSMVLAFFAGSDGIVNENLTQNFCNQVRLPEVTAAYTFQAAMETIHSEAYALLIHTYITDEAEKDRLFNAITTVEGVKRKADWALRWIRRACSFHQRLLAFACVEGIMFSGSFCAIFWMKKRGLLKGLTFSNELISRDEGMHQEFACALYNKLKYRLSTDVVHSIVKEAVECETFFITEALPCSLIGMNAELMTQYIRYVADRLLSMIQVPKIWNVENPFPFMALISLETKGNFFEVRNSQYSRPTTNATNFQVDEDF